MYIKFQKILMFIYSILMIIAFANMILSMFQGEWKVFGISLLAIFFLLAIYNDSQKAIERKKDRIEREAKEEEEKKDKINKELKEEIEREEAIRERDNKIMDGVVFYTLVRYEIYDKKYSEAYGFCILDFNKKAEELEVKTFNNYILVNNEVFVKKKYDTEIDTYYYVNDTENKKYEFDSNLHETEEVYFGEYKKTSLITEKDRIHEEDYKIGYFDIKNKKI